MSGLGALLTAIVTPFDEQLRVDEEAFTNLHHHLCEHGSDGVVAVGTTGEASTLDDAEHLRVIQLACENRPAGTTVIGGTGSNDTRHACHLTERATELGVDAVLVVTPYYNRPNRRGIVRHYEEVAKATDKPIVLYNIPQRTGVDMPNDLLAELAQIDGISAVKQANNDNLAIVDGLDLYAGNDEILGKTLDLGGAGGICVASHVAGDQMKRMVTEPEARAEIDEQLAPLLDALGIAPACISAKAALKLLGVIETSSVRLPMVDASETEVGVIRRGLQSIGLLEGVTS
ncbi:MAG: 4-hydroxy-tetrahydrodipicolinate synthase [Solirubrobacteraceae bacterium]|nr:4-hydroxy-tetrahydrodipicolinate synthase [Solirubrobacteraceae bacterium]